MKPFLPALTSTTSFGVGLVILAVVFELIHHALPQVPMMDAVISGLMAKAIWLIATPQKSSDAPPCAPVNRPAQPGLPEKTS